MPSTILSAIGEPVLHSNDLATVTENWIIVRDSRSQSQALLSIANVSRLKTHKTTNLGKSPNSMYLACSAGSFLVAMATLFSKQGDGATLPFAFVGLGLLLAVHVTRLASVVFVIDSEAVQTRFGSLSEAARLLVAVRYARGSRQIDAEIRSRRYLWFRAYLSLLA
jgi:hypothetical protein